MMPDCWKSEMELHKYILVIKKKKKKKKKINPSQGLLERHFVQIKV